MKAAIVVQVIGSDAGGKNYIDSFNSIFRENLQEYSNRNGYDLIVLEEPFTEDAGVGKKFFWQRLLIPDAFKEYDYVVSMDSDIYVNLDSPAIPFDEIPEGKIAAVNERKYFGNYEWRERIQAKYGWEKTGKDWYSLSGFDRDFNDHINGGLVIYQPKHHAKMFKDLYENNIGEFYKYHQDDQSIISIYGMDNDLIYWLDERYNRIWSFWKEIMYPEFDSLPESHQQLYVRNFVSLNYFTHFTGRGQASLIK
jgi:lipopolysaccharide biosynthesis glycosyltransferase